MPFIQKKQYKSAGFSNFLPQISKEVRIRLQLPKQFDRKRFLNRFSTSFFAWLHSLRWLTEKLMSFMPRWFTWCTTIVARRCVHYLVSSVLHPVLMAIQEACYSSVPRASVFFEHLGKCGIIFSSPHVQSELNSAPHFKRALWHLLVVAGSLLRFFHQILRKIPQVELSFKIEMNVVWHRIQRCWFFWILRPFLFSSALSAFTESFRSFNFLPVVFSTTKWRLSSVSCFQYSEWVQASLRYRGSLIPASMSKFLFFVDLMRPITTW